MKLLQDIVYRSVFLIQKRKKYMLRKGFHTFSEPVLKYSHL